MSKQEVDEFSGKIFGLDLTQQPASTRLAICIGGTFAFYLIYGYLQEKIFSLDGFQYGWYMTLIQFLVYSSCAEFERRVTRDTARKAPLSQYIYIAFFMVATMGLSNTALQFLNYPTQVLFKSCKLIPVMIGGVVLLRRRYSLLEYLSAVFLSAGLCELTLGNAYSDPISLNFVGVTIITCALLADAFLGNLQERTLQAYDVSSREMVYYSHVIGSIYLLVISVAVGQFGEAFNYCYENPEAYLYIVFFSVVGYIGVTFVLAMIKFFGAFIAITVTSCRKFVTIGLSFIIFPKPLTIHYFIASFLVVCGIACHIYSKNADTVDYYMQKYFNIQLTQKIELPQHINELNGKENGTTGQQAQANGQQHSSLTESFSITSPGQMRHL